MTYNGQELTLWEAHKPLKPKQLTYDPKGVVWRVVLQMDNPTTLPPGSRSGFYEYVGLLKDLVKDTAPTPATTQPAPAVVPAPTAPVAPKISYDELVALVEKLRISEARAQQLVADLTRQLDEAQRPANPLLTLTSITPR